MGLKGDHDPLPAVLSLTQSTECGTVYTIEQIRSLCQLAHSHGMKTHMDGARFGNALATLGCQPAEITWKAGIDMLSFGATKNGALAAEAAVFFDPELARNFGKRRMKAGHLLSKMRYVSAQLLAYLEDDLWLQLAAQANAGARQLAAALEASATTRILYPVEANEIFVRMDEATDQSLRAAGFEYHPWPGEPGLFRLVVPYCVDGADIERFGQTLEAI
jgi:threonine aldolase